MPYSQIALLSQLLESGLHLLVGVLVEEQDSGCVLSELG